MIVRKTVLVLGAGASEPYGFPLGKPLLMSICSQLRNFPDAITHIQNSWPHKVTISGLSGYFIECGFRYKEIDEFRLELEKSMQPSVDAFLENRPEYLDLGKAAIAATLIPCEIESVLLSRGNAPAEGSANAHARRWYEYLFHQMGARKEEFPQNKLTIVTFNYDRSLEFFLHTALKNSYGLMAREAADLLSCIPIIHVYGQLGKPSFWAADGRSYSSELTSQIVKRCISEIKIITEQSGTSEELEKAHKFIRDAAVVCFLGSGYHAMNVQRLQIDDLVRPPKRILGSVYHLGTDEIRRVGQLFKPFWEQTTKRARPNYFVLGNPHEDVMQFIKNHPVFD